MGYWTEISTVSVQLKATVAAQHNVQGGPPWWFRFMKSRNLSIHILSKNDDLAVSAKGLQRKAGIIVTNPKGWMDEEKMSEWQRSLRQETRWIFP